jgi:hypothetical protein
MNALLFLHVLAAIAVVGALIAAAVAAAAGLWELVRRTAIAALAGMIGVIALGEGLAADEHAGGGWLDASRGLTVFGLLLGGTGLIILSGPARTRHRLGKLTALSAAVLVILALGIAFVMTAKPS